MCSSLAYLALEPECESSVLGLTSQESFSKNVYPYSFRTIEEMLNIVKKFGKYLFNKNVFLIKICPTAIPTR